MRCYGLAIAAITGVWLAMGASTASAWVRPHGGTSAGAPATSSARSPAVLPGPTLSADAPAPALAKVMGVAPAGLVASPAKPVPLYKRWWFWSIAGGLFAGMVLATYAATRSPRPPYQGTLEPGTFTVFP